MKQIRRTLSAWLTVFVLLASNAAAESPALVAIIIDDLGYNNGLAQRALELPGPVSYGILPALPNSVALAGSARAKHRDVLLHIPMEPIGEQRMGPGGVDTNMDAAQIRATLDNDLLTVPGAIGVSNHMGSRFTGDREAMQHFLSALKKHKSLIVIDSLTTAQTQIPAVAAQYGIPILSRDIFLDNERIQEKIQSQFDQLLKIARKRGRALAIAHPYPETLEFLEQRLHALKTGPVRLVPVSLLLDSQPEK